MKKRRLLIITLSGVVLLAALGATLGYKFYNEHKTRFLREADARLNIDDRQGAIDALRSHLLENPKDYRSLLRLADLLAETGEDESARRIYSRVVYNLYLKHDFPILHSSATWSLELLHGTLIERLDKRITAALEQGEHDSALVYCDSLVAVCKASPYLAPSLRDTTESKRPAGEYLAVWTYNDKVALKAFVQWLSGNADEVLGTIGPSADYLLPEPVGNVSHMTSRQMKLVSLVMKKADEHFDAKQWKQAYSAYKYARDQYVSTLNKSYDEEAGRLQYNMAVCEYNRERYSSASQLLKDLTKKLPDYLTDDRDNLIQAASKNQELKKYESLWEKAGKAFESENWVVAVAHYDDVVQYLFSIGYTDSTDIVAVCRYNMAMAYRNNRQYEDAKNLLQQIQRQSPGYEPLLVKEQLKELQRLIDLFK